MHNWSVNGQETLRAIIADCQMALGMWDAGLMRDDTDNQWAHHEWLAPDEMAIGHWIVRPRYSRPEQIFEATTSAFVK